MKDCNPDSPGMKFDQEKPRTDLVSIEALMGMVAVMTFGAAKYEDRNWEKGIMFNRVYGAALRHIFAWWNGEDLDPETGLSHLDHAATDLHFLSHYVKDMRKYREFDNRPSTKPGILAIGPGDISVPYVIELGPPSEPFGGGIPRSRSVPCVEWTPDQERLLAGAPAEVIDSRPTLIWDEVHQGWRVPG